MESCWTDDDDLCDLRSDAALLRLLAMEMELLEAGAGQRKVRAVTTISTIQVLLMIARGSLQARVCCFLT